MENRNEVENKVKNERAIQQIKVLDSRLGVGVGARKERIRLHKMITG